MTEFFTPVPDSRLVYREIDFTLAAGETLPVNVQFQMLKVIQCSDDTAIVASIGYSTDSIRLAVGLGYGVSTREQEEGRFYNALQITNTSAAPVTLSIAFAFGNITDDRITIGGAINATIVGTPTVRAISAASTTVTRATIAAVSTTILAANANRKSATIKNGGANPLYLGKGVVVANTNTLLLNPGESYTTESTDSINAISVAGATQYEIIEESY